MTLKAPSGQLDKNNDGSGGQGGPASGKKSSQSGDRISGAEIENYLVIDDTPEDVEAIHQAFAGEPVRLHHAATAAKGLQLAAEIDPDCIIMDFELPDMTGGKLLKQFAGGDGRVPCAIIVLTDEKRADAATAVLKAGAMEYFGKHLLAEPVFRRATYGAVERFRLRAERRRENTRNAQLAAIVNSSGDAIVSVMINRQIRTWNPGAEKLFGHSEAEAVGRTTEELIVPGEYRQEPGRHFELVLKDRQSIRYQTVRCHKDGTPIDVEITASPILDGDGEVIGTSVIYRDIREAKRTEEALRESERRFRGIFDSSYQYTGLLSLDGRLLAANRASLDAVGVEDENDVLGAPFWESPWWAAHPEEQERVRDAVYSAANGEFVRFETRYSLRGTEAWSDFSITPVRNEDGDICFLIPEGRDITSLKHAEAAVRRSEQFTRRVLDNLFAFVGVLDLDGTLIQANRAPLEAAGIAAKDVIGKKFWDCYWWQHSAESQLWLRGALERAREGEIIRCDTQVQMAGGTLIWIDFQLAPLYDDAGNLTHLIPSGLDLTQRKEQENQIHMLMREVNHRSKNLLTVVQSIARQTARDARPGEFAIDFGNRLQGLSASQDLVIAGDWTAVSVGDLVRSQITHLGPGLQERIRAEGPPVRITPAAAQGIGMAIHELVTNALKYGALSETGGEVRIAWDVAVEDGLPVFSINWSEHNGPPVKPPNRRGFGQTVIERLSAHAIGGEVDLQYDPAGLTWSLTAPGENVLYRLT